MHRDLKPANILLDRNGSPHLTDFGLASRREFESTVTLDGQLLGTPAYMSPEQASGKSHQADERSDLFSLGVIFYELLTGELPFRGSTRMMLEQIIDGEPTRPRALSNLVPRDLETIALKCLEKEPAKRYPSADAAVADLGRYLHGEPIAARPVGRFERGWRWCKRKPVIAALVVIVMVSMAFGISVSTWLARRAIIARQIADANAARMAESAYAANIYRAIEEWPRGGSSRTTLGLLQATKPDANQSDLRGWEWHYQSNLCSHQLKVLRGHTGVVERVAFSPNGEYVASASKDCTVKLWKAATGRLLRTLSGHRDWVVWVAFSPDGRYLASASGDHTAKLWDVSSGRLLRTFSGHAGWLECLAFSPDGSRLVTASDDNTAIIWDVATGGLSRTLRGHTHQVYGVAFSPDGRCVATTALDSTLRLWDVESGSMLQAQNGFDGEYVAFSPDGRWLATHRRDAESLLNAVSLEELRSIGAGLGSWSNERFSPDGQCIGLAMADETARLWRVADGMLRAELRGHVGQMDGFDFSPDGHRIATASEDLTVHLSYAADTRSCTTLAGHANGATSAAFSPDGSILVAGCGDGTVKLWDMVSGQLARELDALSSQVHSVSVSLDGRYLLAADANSLKIWEFATGALRQQIPCRGLVNATFSRDSLEVYGCTGTDLRPSGERVPGDLIRWRVADGERIGRVGIHTDYVGGVVITEDGRSILSSEARRDAEDKPRPPAVVLWDIATGRSIRTFEGFDGWLVSRVAMSRDGKRLAAGGLDTTVLVWDMQSGALLNELRGHTAVVNAVAFAPDSRRLAAVSDDRSITIWDAISGNELCRLQRHSAPIRSVAFSPDGGWLASASDDGTVKLWDGRPLTKEVRAEREAVGLLNMLFAKPLARQDVVELVRTDLAIDEPARQLALRLIDRYHEGADPQRYRAAAWELAQRPYLNRFQYDFAIRQAKAAVQLAPDDESGRLILAAAHYRNGRPRDTINLLTDFVADATRPDNAPLAVALCFLTLAHRELGDEAHSAGYLTRLHALPAAVPSTETFAGADVQWLRWEVDAGATRPNGK